MCYNEPNGKIIHKIFPIYEMFSLLYIFLAIASLKFLLNLSKYLQCKHYLKKYHHFVTEDKTGWGFTESKPQIVKLFKGAGIQDSIIPHAEPVGWGHISTGHASVFSNMTRLRQDVVSLVLDMFHQAIGVYRARMIETFNPLYWVEFIINLPREILIYLGVSAGSVIVKISQLVYWISAFIMSFLFALYRTELEAFFRSWIDTFVP